jgi:hypothetical protein
VRAKYGRFASRIRSSALMAMDYFGTASMTIHARVDWLFLSMIENAKIYACGTARGAALGRSCVVSIGG